MCKMQWDVTLMPREAIWIGIINFGGLGPQRSVKTVPSSRNYLEIEESIEIMLLKLSPDTEK